MSIAIVVCTWIQACMHTHEEAIGYEYTGVPRQVGLSTGLDEYRLHMCTWDHSCVCAQVYSGMCECVVYRSPIHRYTKPNVVLHFNVKFKKKKSDKHSNKHLR